MSVKTEINRIKTAKTNIKTAIENKGVTVPSGTKLEGMASLINNISSGVGLNFEIVGGTTTPNNPKENTIWINTNTPITNWFFVKDISEMDEYLSYDTGDVFIQIGETSNVKFCALDTYPNILMVYPIFAKQYVSGKWVDKTAKSWQNGKWVDWWNGKLFTPNNQWESVTGGWMIEGNITSEGFINLPSKSGSTCTARTNRAVNKGNYTELKLTIESGKVTIYLSDENGTDEGNWYALLEDATGTATIGLDGVPDTFFVSMYTYYGNVATISNIWLE
jgi:hypothetical protein